MLDARLLRSDPAAVAANLARRGFQLDVERFRALEERRKSAQVAADEVRAARNSHAKTVGKAKAQGQDIAALLAEGEALARRLEGLDKELVAVQTDFDELTLGLPNMLHESVPDGRDETANVEVRRWGTPRTFEWQPLDHVAIGEKLAGTAMDFDAAGKISGARFVVLKGGLARLHRALIQYMLDLHTGQHGYTEIYAPYLVARSSLIGTGQLPKFEADLFKATSGDAEFFLIPTAEVPVTNLVRESILDASTLPRRYAAHTPCFRSEAGSYGKDTRGMIRQHQFEKVELVHVCRPDDSYAELEVLVGHAEKVLQGL
ncbi:MAG TPA: serine--tRNA ligase, partial [Steroidobacteraceae bacterium]|nr:serine--tRNA ligase [Steroidobacteraceae bacterium]